MQHKGNFIPIFTVVNFGNDILLKEIPHTNYTFLREYTKNLHFMP